MLIGKRKVDRKTTIYENVFICDGINVNNVPELNIKNIPIIGIRTG